ncbi:serrate RNA effector molecule homolog isoform X2 [Stylophora pistillata]|uniref:serrate RNA effector molecule homolog isoform X2 n=1 Tax=Stylophora pistillata TaxID=50429 RepID=UPI000C04573A|nr:serrate RNA effector molecule homolog isoform X2 [Stylophora pistillata]
MGDSDEEHDRRRARDKFRRERSDYNDRRRDREERSSRRDEWSDRRREPSWENRRRGEYREFDRGRRDSSGRHHEMSPPMKRVRRDWDEPYHGAGDYNVPYSGVPAHNTWSHPDVQQLQASQQQDARQQRAEVEQQPHPQASPGPAMMTFKQFLNAQDDNIGDEEAFRKYQEYKLEFRKTQISDFFQQHKEEEWFRMKYHPKEMALKQKEYKKSMQRRLSVFLNLLKTGRADDISLDIDNSEAIIKLLDSVVIKLEGGLDTDLVVLNCPPTPPPERRRSSSNPLMSPQTDDMATDVKKEETLQNIKDIKKDPEAGPVSPSSVPLPSAPPPASVKAAASKKENGDMKVMSISNPTLEQQQLQHQAQQYYHQQQLYYQQQEQQQELPQTSQPNEDPPAQQQGVKKEEEPKKKRKRRHREPYYYDAMDDDDSESESESDSEPEPAPPGEEMSPMDTGKEDELLPPGVDAGSKGIEENVQQPDDQNKASQVENIVQLPTSSSNAKLQTSTEDKPDSCEPHVGSSQPETSTSGNGAVTEAGSSHAVVETSGETELSDGTPADSTQGLHGKERKEEFQVETSSTEQAESSTSIPGKDAYQVGSTDNGISTMDKHDSSEIFPEPSSSEAQGKVVSMEAEPSSVSPLPHQVTKPAIEQVLQQVEAIEEEETKGDYNKISEKKEIVENTSPIKEIPKENKEKTIEEKENKEKTIEEKEKDTREEGEERDKAIGEDGKQLCVTAEPRALHKTFSLFMRGIPPNISKADISAVCKRFAGFLRVALSDPSPERKFIRRGWITFDRSVNIKEICWDLNNIRVKDAELSPVVNRDLSRRVRSVAGAALAKQAIRHDIKLAARLIREFDKRAALYEKETKEETEAREKAEKEAAEKTEEGEECEAKPADECEIPDLPNENPILSSLSQDAAEEEEGEEMELMRTTSTSQGDSEEEKPEVDLSCDSSLMRVLDRLILYLRVVHSVDYYNGTDYPYEDEMPNRCGIIHVRGAAPEKCTLSEVQEWQTGINQKLEPFLQEKESLKDEEVAQLGKKDPEAEIEKFVEANTQELAKDKWLCPLSGKKFRGPDFVRKHIFNKHLDKVEAVKMEAEFFNNYLSDPKRPQIPEFPTPQRPPGNHVGQMYGHQPTQTMMGWGPRPQMVLYGPRGPYTPPAYGGYGHEMYGRGHTFPPKPRRFGFGGGRNRGSERGGFHRDPRQIIQYKDLDAPDDAEAF